MSRYYRNNVGYGTRNFSLVKYYFSTLFDRLFYTLLLLLAFVLMTISYKYESLDIYIREQIIKYTRPGVVILEYPVNVMAHVVLEMRDFVLAKRSNRILKLENERLKIAKIEAQNIKDENENLKELLNFVETKSFHNYSSAKVLYADRNNVSEKIIIRAGSKDDLIEGSLVLGNRGSLVGRVVNVGSNVSEVLLLTDMNSKIPVVILGTKRTKVILAGDGSNSPKILYLDDEHGISKGDLIYTAGDGNLIIPGLFIGKVKSVKGNNAKVKLFQSIKTISNVVILDVQQNKYSLIEDEFKNEVIDFEREIEKIEDEQNLISD